MTASPAERVTAQFYEWELLGRGWLLAPVPIDLEPPFTPFFGHQPIPDAAADDGLHHTLLSRVATLFQKKPLRPIQPPEDRTYDIIPFTSDDTLTVFKLHIPKEYHPSSTEAEQFLTMLTFCTTPVSLELLATEKSIRMHCTCRSQYAGYIQGQLKTCFPKLGVSVVSYDTFDLLSEEQSFAVTDFGLEEEFVRPLVQGRSSGIDPLTNLFSIINHFQFGEAVLIQILFNGLVNRWEPSILKSVITNKGEAFFRNAPEMLPMAREKINSPLLAVSIRAYTQADTVDDAMLVLQKIAFALRNSTKSPGNALIPLPHVAYTIEQRLDDIVYRQSHRAGMLLNVRELATLVHVPVVNAPKLWGKTRKTKGVPDHATNHQLILGLNEHEGREIEASLSKEQRMRHMHVIGATGTGKSTLLRGMIEQDIYQGNGVAVLDPHGDLIDEILCRIPEKRIKDVIVVDPSDDEFPLACNILHAHSTIEKEILASDLVAAFKRTSTSWGDQMNSVFANAISAFLESTKGGTLADLRRFLIDKPYRDEFLITITDPGIRYYWQREYPLLKTNSVGPILTRLDTFLRPRIIRNMICQEKGLYFEHILNSKKILLIKLSQGLIGAENSYLLGTLFVSKLHQAAFARQAKEQRPDFFVYIDEFHHFLTPSMEEILSGGRKYHVGLILAHQNLQQLQRQDSSIGASIIGNTGTQVCFRVGETDARKLAEGFSFFEPVDLQNLAVGEAIARIERPEFDFSFSTMLEKAQNRSMNWKDQIIAWSRGQYCTPKNIVEADLATRLYPKDEPIHKPSPAAKPTVVQKEKQEEAQGRTVSTSEHTSKSDTVAQASKRSEQTQHRYLQTLIKKMAEARGYKATIEASIPNGLSKVDVLLEREHLSIACEISVTTDTVWELHNLQKCFDAGYTLIVSCATGKGMKEKMQEAVQKQFNELAMERIEVLTSEELFYLLDELTIQSTATETTYKGYRVKVQYDQLSPEEMSRKRESITKVIVDSLKRMKK